MWLFKKRTSSPSSYERVLDKLSAKIRKSELRVLSLRSSQRRLKGLIVLYTSIAYIVFLVYVLLLRKFRDPFTAVYVVVGPIVIYMIRRCVGFFYGQLLKREESRLQTLKADQRNKIEELKSNTKYYSTKSLLDRYESDLKDVKDLKKSSTGSQRNSPKKTSNRDFDISNVPSLPPPQADTSASDGSPQNLQSAMFSATEPFTMTPVETHWYDRLLDVIIGEDERSPRNRYALICPNCFSHNGLAPPGQSADSVKYVCPVCGHLNPEHASDFALSTANSDAGESQEESEHSGERHGENTNDSMSFDEDDSMYDQVVFPDEQPIDIEISKEGPASNLRSRKPKTDS
ncbi:hypothetical protein V1511DRAFT_506422 [Dipodascopsis uninucleata]